MRLYSPLVVLMYLGSAGTVFGDGLPHHKVPDSLNGNLVVGLCDGETWTEVPGVKPGDPMTRAQAQQVADNLMAQWRAKHPDAAWVVAEADPQQGAGSDPEASAAAYGKTSRPETLAAANAAGQVQTYGAFTERDKEIWKASTDKLIAEGKRIFHDANALGSTDAISCDMCHPDAANTHPETYPKYQVQLGRVALLRDMINWCIENPVRGKPFADDDPRMKALEAYIISQRKGVPLDYGRH